MPGYSSDRVSKLSSSTLKALNLSNTFWADSILVSTFLMHLFPGGMKVQPYPFLVRRDGATQFHGITNGVWPRHLLTRQSGLEVKASRRDLRSVILDSFFNMFSSKVFSFFLASEKMVASVEEHYDTVTW